MSKVEEIVGKQHDDRMRRHHGPSSPQWEGPLALVAPRGAYKAANLLTPLFSSVFVDWKNPLGASAYPPPPSTAFIADLTSTTYSSAGLVFGVPCGSGKLTLGSSLRIGNLHIRIARSPRIGDAVLRVVLTNPQTIRMPSDGYLIEYILGVLSVRMAAP